jgi:rhamnogalacturonyl hydrolase YesR
MDNEIKSKTHQLANEAMFQLKRYPYYSFKEHLLRFWKRITFQKIPPYDRMSWQAGLLANALVSFYQNNRNIEVSLVIKAALLKYFKKLISKQGKFYYLDSAVVGLALIEIHQITQDERFLALLRDLVHFLKNHDADEEGSLIYRPGHNKHIYAESIGMLCPFLCRYGSTYDDPASITLAVKQMRNFQKNGMDSRSGLPYHGYDCKSQIRHGIIGWAQACGWLMLGMIDSLLYMNPASAEYDEIKQNFRRLVDKVEGFQREDGLYPWHFPAGQGYHDTFASAMILYAIAQGMNLGILIGVHRSRVIRGRDTLAKAMQEGEIGHAEVESEGFGLYPQIYKAFPQTQGMVLSLFSATNKANNE